MWKGLCEIKESVLHQKKIILNEQPVDPLIYNISKKNLGGVKGGKATKPFSKPVFHR